MPNFLKTKVELPHSGPLFIILAILAVITTISNSAKGSRYFGYYLLGFSFLIFISGIGMAFSKKERERTRAKVIVELPERAALINAPDADKITQRRGFYLLTVGLALFLIWCWLFGFSSLAIGV
jgi:hypothetical protein